MAGTITLVTGRAGSGKTYRRAPLFVFTEFLPNRTGDHISNFPWKRDRVVEYCEEQGYDAERIRVIPPEELLRWEKGVSGPWRYFSGVDIGRCHIAIDEIHRYCGKHHKAAHRAEWGVWFGQARHRGATVELLTQSIKKVAGEVVREAELRIEIVNSYLDRDPIFGICAGDWHQFWARWTGNLRVALWEIERRADDEYWNEQRREKFRFNPFWYAFYDSYSAPSEMEYGSQTEAEPHERFPGWRLYWWFLRRHFGRVGWRLTLAGLMVWVCFLGGMRTLLGGVMVATKAGVTSNTGKPSTRGVAVAASNAPGVAGVPSSVASAASRPAGSLPIRGVAASGPAEGVDLVPAVELVAARAELSEVQSRLAAIQAEVMARDVVWGLGRDWVLLGGRRYKVGSEVVDGVYKGKQVKSVDLVEGLVLVGDERLYVRRLPERPKGGAAADAGVVRDGGADRHDAAGGGSGSGGHNDGSRGAAGRFTERVGAVGSAGGGLGRRSSSRSDDVGYGPTRARLPGPVGPTDRGGSRSSGFGVLPGQSAAGGSGSGGVPGASGVVGPGVGGDADGNQRGRKYIEPR